MTPKLSDFCCFFICKRNAIWTADKRAAILATSQLPETKATSDIVRLIMCWERFFFLQMDNRMRAWYTKNMSVGLLYTCSLGGVRPDRPVALLHKSSNNVQEIVPMEHQHPKQREQVSCFWHQSVVPFMELPHPWPNQDIRRFESRRNTPYLFCQKYLQADFYSSDNWCSADTEGWYGRVLACEESWRPAIAPQSDSSLQARCRKREQVAMWSMQKAKGCSVM